MNAGMSPKALCTRADVEAEARAPAALLIVDDFPGVAALFAQRYLRCTPQLRVPVICATGLGDMRQKLYGREGNEPGRRPLRGGLLDLFLGSAQDLYGETALEIIDWLQNDRYPLLMPVAYCGGGADLVELLCKRRGWRFVHAIDGTPRQLVEFPNEATRAALLGTIARPGHRSVPVFDKRGMLEDPEVLRYLERAIFAPWDAFCRDARELAIAEAGDGRVMNLGRRVFRTLDALIEGVADERIGHARGLTEAAARQDLHLLRSVVGPLVTFRRRWERLWRTTRTDPVAGDRWQPLPDGPLTGTQSFPDCPGQRRRPAARRAR